MRKTISIAAYNRPARLLGLLSSLKAQLRPLNEYRLIISVDGGGPRSPKVVQVAKSVDFMDCHVFSHERNVGVNRNTYESISTAFEKFRSDYNLYLEDDLVLAADALNLVEWCIEKDKSTPRVAAYCLCNLQSKTKDPSRLTYSRAFCGWGFLMSFQKWRECAKPKWLQGESMWDNRVANYIRELPAGYRNVFPDISRTKNVGREGVHCTPKKLKRLNRNMRFQDKRSSYAYYLE